MKTINILIAGIFSLLLIVEASADGRRSRRYQNPPNNWVVPQQNYVVPSVPIPTPPVVGKVELEECRDALDEVNAERAKRGLRPYLNDPLLNKGAYSCAKYRAERLISGHCPNGLGDFEFLPPEVNVNGVVGGCAAWREGFGACGLYGNYTYCGAAWKRGADGLKYCHVFLK